MTETFFLVNAILMGGVFFLLKWILYALLFLVVIEFEKLKAPVWRRFYVFMSVQIHAYELFLSKW